MRILIQNYASESITEPLYFDACFKKVSGIESHLWNTPSISTFDMFDSLKPDLFITNFKYMTNDIIKYLSGSSKKIESIVNMSGANQSHIDTVCGVFGNHKIKCPFLFTNIPLDLNTLIRGDIKLESILNGADIFLTTNAVNVPDFNLEAAIISMGNSDVVKEVTEYNTYHKLYLGAEPNDDFDMSVSMLNMSALYHKYNDVIIADEIQNIFSQVLFDALLYSKKVTIKAPAKQQEKADKIFKSIFTHDIKNSENLRSEIKRSHTCMHRTKRLLLKLKCKNEVDEMDRIIEEIK